MNVPFKERRRWPRTEVEGSGRLTEPLAMTARVKDVSLAGMLLATPARMEQGERCRLNATLDGRPLNADIEVRHVSRERSTSNAYRVGARFVSLDSTAQAVLRDWLAGIGNRG